MLPWADWAHGGLADRLTIRAAAAQPHAIIDEPLAAGWINFGSHRAWYSPGSYAENSMYVNGPNCSSNTLRPLA